MHLKPAYVLLSLLILTVLVSVVHVAQGGSFPMSFSEVLAQLQAGPLGPGTGRNFVIWGIRLPRTVVCLFAGGILGTVGSTFQALMRNPLADPYVVGVSSGAAVGGSLALVTGWGAEFGDLRLCIAGFVTGMATMGLVYALASRRGVVDVRTLLLAGVVTGSLLTSVLSLVILCSGRTERDVLNWLLGDTSLSSWPRTLVVAGALLIGFPILFLQTRRLNAFALGAETAQRLGVNVGRLTKIMLIVGGAMTAAVVGTVGIIGFLGLVAPHIARRLVGVDWRWSLPASMLTGSLLLLCSDLVAQRFFNWATHSVGMDMPVGIVTSVLGAPALLILLRAPAAKPVRLRGGSVRAT